MACTIVWTSFYNGMGLYKHNPTHCRQNSMAAIFWTTFCNGFSWIKIYEIWFKFHWHLFLCVQLTILQHCHLNRATYGRCVSRLSSLQWGPPHPVDVPLHHEVLREGFLTPKACRGIQMANNHLASRISGRYAKLFGNINFRAHLYEFRSGWVVISNINTYMCVYYLQFYSHYMISFYFLSLCIS